MVTKKFDNMYQRITGVNVGEMFFVTGYENWLIYKVVDERALNLPVRTAEREGYIIFQFEIKPYPYTVFADKNPTIDNVFDIPGATWYNFETMETFKLAPYEINRTSVWVGDKGTFICNSTVSVFDIFRDGSAVALYEFNENTNDTGGKYNLDKLVGVEAYKPGIAKSGFYFNRRTYLQATNFTTFPTEAAISVWVKPEKLSASYCCIWHCSRRGDNYFSLWYRPRNKTFYMIVNEREYELRDQKYLPNEWYHIVADTKGNVWINGTKKISNAYNIDLSQARYPFLVGADYDGLWAINDWFKGTVDQLRFFNRTLTDDEVQRLYKEHIKEPDKTTTETTTVPVPVYKFKGTASPSQVIDTKKEFNFTKNDSFTFVARFRLRESTTKGKIAPILGKINYQYSLMIYNDRIRFTVWDDPGAEVLSVASHYTIPKNKEMVIAFVYDGQNFQGYFVKDGKKDSWVLQHRSYLDFRTLSETVKVGDCYIWHSPKASITINGVEIYDKALTNEEIELVSKRI